VRQSRAVLERQARLLEQSHEAIFVHNMDGSIEYWNHGAELLYGFTRRKLWDVSLINCSTRTRPHRQL